MAYERIFYAQTGYPTGVQTNNGRPSFVTKSGADKTFDMPHGLLPFGSTTTTDYYDNGQDTWSCFDPYEYVDNNPLNRGLWSTEGATIRAARSGSLKGSIFVGPTVGTFSNDNRTINPQTEVIGLTFTWNRQDGPTDTQMKITKVGLRLWDYLHESTVKLQMVQYSGTESPLVSDGNKNNPTSVANFQMTSDREKFYYDRSSSTYNGRPVAMIGAIIEVQCEKTQLVQYKSMNIKCLQPIYRKPGGVALYAYPVIPQHPWALNDNKKRYDI